MHAEHAWLRIVDVRTGATREVPDFETPSAFIFLHDALRFLAVHGPVVSLYNCRGEVVTRFADHRLWQSDGSTNNVFVTANQKVGPSIGASASSAKPAKPGVPRRRPAPGFGAKP